MRSFDSDLRNSPLMASLFKTALISLLGSLTLCMATASAQSIEGTSVQVEETQDATDLPAVEQEVSPPVDIWDRVRRGYAIPDIDTPKVRQAIKFYSARPDYIRRITERSSKYLYHILEEVESRNMPTELALLPFVESAFQPEALSRAKASGLWQFMPATGRVFDLQQNLWKDERRDITESTRAALDYFQKLYGMFNDWQLALAAYNWGEGSVMRAIRAAKAKGKPADYLHLRMPKETANYVPKLQAIKELIRNPEKYGIELPPVDNEPYFVRVTKSRDIDLSTAAELAEMDQQEFRLLNPGFNLPVIVASHNSSFLLPRDQVGVFMNNLASWVNTGKPLSSWLLYHVKKGDTLEGIAQKSGMTVAELRRVNRIPTGRKVLEGSALLVDAHGNLAPEIEAEALSARVAFSAPPNRARRVVYRVRRGDTIYMIAKRYGITQKSIRKSNHLRASQLRIGQRLVLDIPGSARASTVNRAPASRSHTSRSSRASAPSTQRTYKVRRGDSLFSIAKRFRTTPQKIRQANKLKSNNIVVGKKLVIP